MDQPPLDNPTAFAADPQMIIGKRGEHLVVAVKATYELVPTSPRLDLAPKSRRRGLRHADIPWGKPESTSIKYPADITLPKPGTDVVVVSKAFPPVGDPVKRFDVAVQVGPLRADLVVHGLRVWDNNGSWLSSALQAKPVELRYENAWGGRDDSDPGACVEEPRNPVGLGIARRAADLTGKMAPCIEYAEFPMSDAHTRPPPAGVGVVGRNWEPRRSYAGTYDKAWQENRAPLLPDDEDDRIRCFASRGLHAEQPLFGVEEVTLLNLLPNGQLAQFCLPGVGVEVNFLVKNREPDIQQPHLDTVLIDTLGVEDGQPLTVELLWHASTKAPRRMLDSTTVIKGIRVA
ncbi:MAG: DUF2169 domain-containing protein [Myxococcales bacterium]